MEINLTKELQKNIKKFQNEILFNEQFKKFDIISVFIDKKNADRRCVIIINENENKIEQLEKMVKTYFHGKLFKIIKRTGNPENTLIETGKGIRHINGHGWGTLGGIFHIHNDQNFLYGLSNNHVIAKSNMANQGDPIIYERNNQIGNLFRYIPLHAPPRVNYIDAAIFRINSHFQTLWRPQKPRGTIGPRIHLRVYKNGRTSGMTAGYIKAYNGSVRVILNGLKYNFVNVIAIKGINRDFNMPGDSGSIVFTRNHYMVGIVFAKYHDYCYALPISRIKPLLER